MIDWRILAAMRLKWQCSGTVKSGVGIYKEKFMNLSVGEGENPYNIYCIARDMRFDERCIHVTILKETANEIYAQVRQGHGLH
jgi:hypothetical protein